MKNNTNNLKKRKKKRNMRKNSPGSCRGKPQLSGNINNSASKTNKGKTQEKMMRN